ncbi:MAG: phospholipid/glycerol acyltransferase [Ferruginibacter sp.]|uniref:1-acyl-sn-glycerol-3-phosphate acyltransferase n=1 Tax=Ferruginibacter sp. TaxID=1940288 RepID=UPI00265A2948|nr:1-acyl-sn-glycerol-3-phosphate acyltransferase [Ferruginibacter sp.]MDB5280194.1 phospholipid/glycerol acyltransferase [Ferruginibacter sp.]
MLHYFFKIYLKLTGWKATGPVPKDLKKFIMVVGPHTSSSDVFMGFAFRSVLKLKHIKFIAKQELFKPPFGFLFRQAGGVPVDRFNKNNFVDQVAEMFIQNESFAIALSPEGTRKKVDRLRTGFYHIAKKANVPIVMLAFDFEHKEFRFAPLFFTTDDEAADYNKILTFFTSVKGKNPELGLEHLLN